MTDFIPMTEEERAMLSDNVTVRTWEGRELDISDYDFGEHISGVPVKVDGKIVGRAQIFATGKIVISATVDPHIAAELTRQFMANFRDGFTLIATFAEAIPATEKVDFMDAIPNSNYGKALMEDQEPARLRHLSDNPPVELTDATSKHPTDFQYHSAVDMGKVDYSFLPGKTTSETPDYLKRAKDVVMSYILSRLEITDARQAFDVYVVTFTKTLQNWKAMVSSTLPDGMYYEVTYNGDKGETYIDAYKKFDNVCIKD